MRTWCGTHCTQYQDDAAGKSLREVVNLWMLLSMPKCIF